MLVQFKKKKKFGVNPILSSVENPRELDSDDELAFKNYKIIASNTSLSVISVLRAG